VFPRHDVGVVGSNCSAVGEEGLREGGREGGREGRRVLGRREGGYHLHLTCSRSSTRRRFSTASSSCEYIGTFKELGQNNILLSSLPPSLPLSPMRRSGTHLLPSLPPSLPPYLRWKWHPLRPLCQEEGRIVFLQAEGQAEGTHFLVVDAGRGGREGGQVGKEKGGKEGGRGGGRV